MLLYHSLLFAIFVDVAVSLVYFAMATGDFYVLPNLNGISTRISEEEEPIINISLNKVHIKCVRST